MKGDVNLRHAAPAAAAPASGRSGRGLAGLLTAMGVAAILAVGLWGVSFTLGATHDLGPRWVGVPGGHVRVGELTNTEVDHSLMKGTAAMADADAVPPGYTRVSVDVSVSADDEDIVWEDPDFVMTSRDGTSATPVRTELGDGKVPFGTQVSGTITFDVRRDAVGFSLSFRGGEAIELEAAPGVDNLPPGPVPDHEEYGTGHGAPPPRG